MLIEKFSEHLAQRRLVIVFDDYIWDGAKFWLRLFSRLISHLRTSKVYILTASTQYKLVPGEYVTVPISGFTTEEAEAFFKLKEINTADLGNMMEVAHLSRLLAVVFEAHQRRLRGRARSEQARYRRYR